MSFYYVYGDESSSDSDYGRHHHHGSHHAQYGHHGHHGHHSHHGHSRSDLRSSHHEHRSGSRRHQRQAERSPSPPLRAPRPPPATKAKRCKRHRARSPSPTERAVSAPLAARGRRYGTREEYRNGDSDSDEPGVQSRHGRRRSPTTRNEYDVYARLDAQGGRIPLPRPAVWAYNPRARSPPPNIRSRHELDDEPLPGRSNFYLDGSDEEVYYGGF